MNLIKFKYFITYNLYIPPSFFGSATAGSRSMLDQTDIDLVTFAPILIKCYFNRNFFNNFFLIKVTSN